MNFVEYKYKDIGKIRSGKRLKKDMWFQIQNLTIDILE